MFDCIKIILHNVLIYLCSLASFVCQASKASDTVCIMAIIFHVCIMVQTAWKARLHTRICVHFSLEPYATSPHAAVCSDCFFNVALKLKFVAILSLPGSAIL